MAEQRRHLAPPSQRAAWAAVAVTLVVVGIAHARARWPGYLPLGSDNDEYQLVAGQLAELGAPVVAGVEGTKYPLGYPAILAVFERFGLTVPVAAVVLNLVAITVAVGLVTWVVGRATTTSPSNSGAGLAAGAVLATSVSVWNDAFSVMPEVLTLAVLVGAWAVVAGGLTSRRLLALSGLGVVAVLLKTLAAPVIVGGSALLWLVEVLRRRRAGATVPSTDHGAAEPSDGRSAGAVADAEPTRTVRAPTWALAWPALAGAATVLAGMLVMRPYPGHTTGYVATFLLRDPFDASLGALGPVGLARRALADVPETLADIGRAMAFIDASTTVAASIALVGLAIGVLAAFNLRPGGPLGIYTLGAVLGYVAALSAWPYHSSRFGLPLVPVAALGAGWLVRLVSDRLHRSAALHLGVAAVGGTLVLVSLLSTSYDAAAQRGVAASERLAVQHAALDRLERWAAQELSAEEEVVSFDYREVARHLGRPVQPFAYTSDVAELDAMLGDADVVVLVDFHHTRNRQLRLLLEATPERFEQVLEADGLGVWRVVDATSRSSG